MAICCFEAPKEPFSVFPLFSFFFSILDFFVAFSHSLFFFFSYSFFFSLFLSCFFPKFIFSSFNFFSPIQTLSPKHQGHLCEEPIPRKIFLTHCDAKQISFYWIEATSSFIRANSVLFFISNVAWKLIMLLGNWYLVGLQ